MTRLFAIVVGLIAVASCRGTSVQVKEFPNASDLRGPRDSAVVLGNAREDLFLLQQKMEPVHAAPAGRLYDGGTRYFEGPGYRMIDHRRLKLENGRNGRIVGQTIFFERSATGGSELQYSNARFVASNQAWLQAPTRKSEPSLAEADVDAGEKLR